jgi:hypothetical protein
MRRGRAVLGMLAGAALWALLWVGGAGAAAAAFPGFLPTDAPVTAPGPLLALILYSGVLSIAAGYTTAAVGRSMRPVHWLAGLQLALGIMIETSGWHLTPVWYHLVFLLLLVPLTLLGGHLKARTRPDVLPAVG